MAKQPTQRRKLAAIMFADIVGYSALMQQDEVAAAKARARHREVFQAEHDRFHGQIIQYYGDGALSIFPSGVDAVQCATSIQQHLQTGEPQVPLRIGIHVGDIVHDKEEVYGDGVNVAARIESKATPGSVFISGRLNDELSNQPGIDAVFLGHFQLKNIQDPVPLFAIEKDGLHVPDAKQLGGIAPPSAKAIAVLPFVNRSGKENDAYFCDGMTEEIINALVKVEGLQVTSRTSAFHFKNTELPLAQIGEALNVSIILEGSIQLSGKRMRLTARLIDVAQDTLLFSDSFDREIADIFAVQDDVSLLIADRLREHLGHFDIPDHLVKPPDATVEAYMRYLKARYLILKMQPDDIETGMALLKRLIQQHPDYALAYLGMHLGHIMQGALGFTLSAEAFAEGHPYLEKAIALEPDHPECQLQLSYRAFLQDWDLPAAYGHLQKVRDSRPSVDYYQSMASVLLAEGKTTAALNYMETALQMDPMSNISHHLKGTVLYLQESFPEAIEHFQRSLAINPQFEPSRQYLAQALVLSGRGEEALLLVPAEDTQEHNVLAVGIRTLVQAAHGDREAALRGMALLEAAKESGAVTMALEFLAFSQVQLGDKEAALQSLEQSVSMRLPLVVYSFAEPLYKALHGEARFQALKTRVLGHSAMAPQPAVRYKQPLFEADDLLVQKRRLVALMEQETPYLNPDLTLRQLAEQMEIPANHLSQLLNEGFGQNFAAFINAHRLEAFKAKAADPEQRHLTILALAYACGFNSKTAFNTYFKRQMGMTPSAYWKETAPV